MAASTSTVDITKHSFFAHCFSKADPTWNYCFALIIGADGVLKIGVGTACGIFTSGPTIRTAKIKPSELTRDFLCGALRNIVGRDKDDLGEGADEFEHRVVNQFMVQLCIAGILENWKRLEETAIAVREAAAVDEGLKTLRAGGKLIDPHPLVTALCSNFSREVGGCLWTC